jgi:GT2 family glycosyltransferase
MRSQLSTPLIWVHLTSYQDEQAASHILKCLTSQSRSPDLIRIIDNSPTPLNIDCKQLPVQIDHQPTNLGTAGAINRSITAATLQGVDYLWLLDQDSQPCSNLLAELLAAHQQLIESNRAPVGIVAPLTRNRDDAQINRPMRWDRYKPLKVRIGDTPIKATLLPAAGMLLHIPSIAKIALPSDRYFLDCYDFALGLAVKDIGVYICAMPQLELSHQVSQKIKISTAEGEKLVTDMPANRVELLHRNMTYLATRHSKGIYRAAAAINQGFKAFQHARRISRYNLEDRNSKSCAALSGWLKGLFALPKPRN